MRATVIVDNISAGEIKGEWGLCIYIEYGENRILLDAGASDLFLSNAEKLGIDISDVDYAVLSHAHYDHANGMRAFFKTNHKAKFYLREGSEENCFAKKWIFHKYIGMPKHILEEEKERIVFVKGDVELLPGVYLIPHKTEGLDEVGMKNHMYTRKDGKWVADDFSHEQSLVLDTEAGLVVFNSCSHGGADNIIHEIADTFPEKKICALIGGFHIFNKSEAEVRTLAQNIKKTGIESVYTGHCTGERAFRILEEELGDRVHQLHIALEINF